MTKAELIEALRIYPDDFQVIISRDAEGNSYSPLESFYGGHYIPDNEWSGQVDMVSYPDRRKEDVKKDMKYLNAIILSPAF